MASWNAARWGASSNGPTGERLSAVPYEREANEHGTCQLAGRPKVTISSRAPPGAIGNFPDRAVEIFPSSFALRHVAEADRALAPLLRSALA